MPDPGVRIDRAQVGGGSLRNWHVLAGCGPGPCTLRLSPVVDARLRLYGSDGESYARVDLYDDARIRVHCTPALGIADRVVIGGLGAFVLGTAAVVVGVVLAGNCGAGSEGNGSCVAGDVLAYSGTGLGLAGLATAIGGMVAHESNASQRFTVEPVASFSARGAGLGLRVRF